uniref:SET domain-containing protein n=1 Tax=Mucochytrium quahogii TaxID=96639 RepID=A0A7S2S8S2_9STRA|mmetsp:Transcript_45245/g.72605  ORF Transcript_45245/g.72605 Transcript_45245/m.72605 type:complete len:420 (+) Transcript_45245:338-1597(+)
MCTFDDGSGGMFMSWLANNGCVLEGIELQGRSVLVCKAVKRFETLIAIPKEVVIRHRTACEDDDIGEMFRDKMDCPPFSNPARVLTVFLFYLKLQGRDTKWYWYIQNLPTYETFDDFVDNWEDDDLDCLDPTLKLLCQGVKADINRTYQQTLAVIDEYIPRATTRCRDKLLEVRKCLSFENYRFAYLCVESRAFLDRFPGGEMRPLLIPFADMLDHDPSFPSALGDNHQSCVGGQEFEDGAFIMRADRDIRRGGTVYNNYGRRTNRELLITYGFILRNNIWEYVTIHPPWANFINSTPREFRSPLERQKYDVLYHQDTRDYKLFGTKIPDQKLLWLFDIWTCTSQASLSQLINTRVNNLSISVRAASCMLREIEHTMQRMARRPARVNMKPSRVALVNNFHETRLGILQAHVSFLKKYV